MKRELIILAAIFGLASVSFSQVSVGIDIPFSGTSFAFGEVKRSESWVGVYGTIEANFFSVHRTYTCPSGGEITKQLGNTPVFGIELRYGSQTSLGGKDTQGDSTISEYKNSGSVVAILLKYYLPMAEESRLHLYVGTGPEISMITREKKDEENKYVEEGELTNVRFLAPLGLDYDINEDRTVKLNTSVSFGYSLFSTLAKSGTGINYGIGAGLKYCF